MRSRRSVHVPRGDGEEQLTESKEGEDGDDEGEVLHIELYKGKWV